MRGPIRVLAVGPDFDADPAVARLDDEHDLSVTVASADDALARLDAVDCVVCGHDPADGGRAVLAELCDADPELPVVVFAESDPDAPLDGVFEAGATDYVRRIGGRQVPVLANRIERAVDHRRLRRRSEAVLRRERDERDRIVETSPIGIVIVDADGAFRFGNGRAGEILGFSPADLDDAPHDAPSLDITDADGNAFDGDDHPFRLVVEDGERLVAREVRVRRADGERIWLSVNGAPLGESSEGVARAVFAFEDITHRKEREAELERTVDQLQRSNRKLQRFAYITSHDLQEPLRMVSAYLQLLESRYADDLDGDALEFIDFAVDGAERMRDMINDLLAYSRIDTHGEPFETVDVNELLGDVRADLRIGIEEADAEVTADDLPTVAADRKQLDRLLRDLVSNGIKYNHGEPRVHVSAERLDGAWRFSVSDDGIGIEDRHRERVFEVFKRLHGTQEYSGTGIGLAVCQKIVERHDGRIWVDSEPGAGSTFHFTIPVTDTDHT